MTKCFTIYETNSQKYFTSCADSHHGVTAFKVDGMVQEINLSEYPGTEYDSSIK